MLRTYRVNHCWRAARREALRRARGRCEVCGESDGVEVHHDSPVGPEGYGGRSCAHHQENLYVLCAIHHREHEQARRAAERGKPTQLTLVAA